MGRRSMVGLPLIKDKEKWTEIEKKRWVFTWDTYRIMGMIATEISKLKLNNGRTFKVKIEIPTKIFVQTLSDKQWDDPRPSKTCPENITQLVLIVERARSPYLRVYQNADQMKAQSLPSKAK